MNSQEFTGLSALWSSSPVWRWFPWSMAKLWANLFLGALTVFGILRWKTQQQQQQNYPKANKQCRSQMCDQRTKIMWESPQRPQLLFGACSNGGQEKEEFGWSQVVLFLLTGLDYVSLWSPCMSFLLMHQISITPCPTMQRPEMVDRRFAPNLHLEGTVCLSVPAPKSYSGLIGHPMFPLRDI